MSFSKGAVEVIESLEKKGFTLERIVKMATKDKEYSLMLQQTIQMAGLVK